ncbi:hypothetical protein M2387_004082 [Klebsiella sp. BIGb0407]|nr:hypothetical protein [Klebsiella sp. BIGb0407]
MANLSKTPNYIEIDKSVVIDCKVVVTIVIKLCLRKKMSTDDIIKLILMVIVTVWFGYKFNQSKKMIRLVPLLIALFAVYQIILPYI